MNIMDKLSTTNPFKLTLYHFIMDIRKALFHISLFLCVWYLLNVIPSRILFIVKVVV